MKGWIQDMWDSGLEGYSTVDKEGYGTGKEGSEDVEIACRICFYAYICISYPKMREIFKQINKLLTRQL